MNPDGISNQAIQIPGIGSGHCAARSIAASFTSFDKTGCIMNWAAVGTESSRQYLVFMLEATTNQKASFMSTLILALLLIIASPSWARNYYFATGGNDRGACTQASPCASLSKLNSLSLNPGDGIFLNRGDTFVAGSSPNGIDFSKGGGSGTSDNHITISAYGSGNRPIVQKNGKGYGLICIEKDYLDISHIDFNGFAFSVELRGCQHITIDNIIARNAQQHCVAYRYRSTSNRPSLDVVMTNNTIFGCGSSQTANGEGIYLGSNTAADTSGNFIVRDNYVHDTFNECIEQKFSVVPPMVIERNTFDHCNVRDQNPPINGNSGVGMVLLGNAGVGNANTTIRYNWFRNIVGSNADTGIGLRIGEQGIDMTYNLITQNQRYGVLINKRATATGFLCTLHHNTLYGNGLDAISIGGSPSTSFSDNVAWANGGSNDASNPLFVNAGAYDFNLSAGSPALGTGNGGTNKGAIQTFAITEATLLGDGITVRVTGNVYAPYQPISAGTASAFTITCAKAGIQVGQTLTPNGSNTALVTVRNAIRPLDTCTLAATAGALQDSARIGGALAPGGPLNSTSLAITGLPVTSGRSISGDTAPKSLPFPGPKRSRITGETPPDGSMR
jgi:hypothetical protein